MVPSRQMGNLIYMTQIFLNPATRWRLIFRVLFFFGVFLLFNIPLQMGLQEMLPSGILRSNLSTSIVFFSVMVSLYAQVKYFDKTSFDKYGMAVNGKWLAEFGFGFLVAAFQIGLFFLVLYWSNQLTIVNHFVLYASDQTFLSTILTETFRQLQVGIFEELLSRAFLFFVIYEMLKSFRQSSNRSILISCIFNSLVFGLLHLENDNATMLSAFNLAVDALTLCLPFLLTGRLGMSIGMHFSWNLMQGAVFGFANSGLDVKASIFQIELTDHPITGGEFGPEGSTILLGLSVLAMCFIYVWKRWRNIENWIQPKFQTYGVGQEFK